MAPLTVYKKDNSFTKSEMEQTLPKFGEKLLELEGVVQLLSLSNDCTKLIPITN